MCDKVLFQRLHIKTKMSSIAFHSSTVTIFETDFSIFIFAKQELKIQS